MHNTILKQIMKESVINTKKRIEYIDFIKTFAMFIVTFGHCAQSLSGEVFPERIIPKDLFISIHMPLFMIASGFFINIDKIRDSKFGEYILDKAKRLMLPLTSWYAIWCLVTQNKPATITYTMIYWYLFALFISLITIKILSTKIKSNNAVLAIAAILVLLIPSSAVAHINFMFPFLIFGYILRRYIDNLGTITLVISGVAFLLLYQIWDISHTVYQAPLLIKKIDLPMIYSFLLRFLIGTTGSTFIFILAKKLNNSSLIKMGAQFGQYTIGFYTMTTILNAITLNALNHIGFHITNPIMLELASILLTFVEMYVIYIFSKTIKPYRILSLILLGEDKK